MRTIVCQLLQHRNTSSWTSPRERLPIKRSLSYMMTKREKNDNNRFRALTTPPINARPNRAEPYRVRGRNIWLKFTRKLPNTGPRCMSNVSRHCTAEATPSIPSPYDSQLRVRDHGYIHPAHGFDLPLNFQPPARGPQAQRWSLHLQISSVTSFLYWCSRQIPRCCHSEIPV